MAYGANLPKVPRAMTHEDIARVQADFVAAARRAVEAGFECRGAEAWSGTAIVGSASVLCALA